MSAIVEASKACPEVHNTVKKSLTGGLIAGVPTVVGGLVAGPVGMAVGATIGVTGTLYYAGQVEFKSLPEVFENMTNEEKEKVLRHVIRALGLSSLKELVAFVATGENVKLVGEKIAQYLKK